LPIYGEKIAAFLKNQCYDRIFAKTSSGLSIKRQYYRLFVGKNILKIITSVPKNPFSAENESDSGPDGFGVVRAAADA
jgi:hypothetical protein